MSQPLHYHASINIIAPSGTWAPEDVAFVEALPDVKEVEIFGDKLVIWVSCCTHALMTVVRALGQRFEGIPINWTSPTCPLNTDGKFDEVE